MPTWRCRIHQCGETFNSAPPLIRHQVTEHEPCRCEICGVLTPDGGLAILHAFEAHSRAEFVRAYGASSDEIRLRENIRASLLSTSGRTELEKNVAYRYRPDRASAHFIVTE